MKEDPQTINGLYYRLGPIARHILRAMLRLPRHLPESLEHDDNWSGRILQKVHYVSILANQNSIVLHSTALGDTELVYPNQLT
jgi:hypothetical protein